MISRLDKATSSHIQAGSVVPSLAQVLASLVQNSLEAQATRVIVSVSLDAIRVWDNGVGISPSLLRQLGERGVTTKNSEGKNHHLGQTISAISEAGNLFVTSTHQNRTFTKGFFPGFKLPSHLKRAEAGTDDGLIELNQTAVTLYKGLYTDDRSHGTLAEVFNLYQRKYPVRHRNLKPNDLSIAQQEIETLSLIHTKVHIDFVATHADRSSVRDLLPCKSIFERATQFLGSDLSEVTIKGPTWSLEGAVSKCVREHGISPAAQWRHQLVFANHQLSMSGIKYIGTALNHYISTELKAEAKEEGRRARCTLPLFFFHITSSGSLSWDEIYAKIEQNLSQHWRIGAHYRESQKKRVFVVGCNNNESPPLRISAADAKVFTTPPKRDENLESSRRLPVPALSPRETQGSSEGVALRGQGGNSFQHGRETRERYENQQLRLEKSKQKTSGERGEKKRKLWEQKRRQLLRDKEKQHRQTSKQRELHQREQQELREKTESEEDKEKERVARRRVQAEQKEDKQKKQRRQEERGKKERVDLATKEGSNEDDIRAVWRRRYKQWQHKKVLKNLRSAELHRERKSDKTQVAQHTLREKEHMVCHAQNQPGCENDRKSKRMGAGSAGVGPQETSGGALSSTARVHVGQETLKESQASFQPKSLTRESLAALEYVLEKNGCGGQTSGDALGPVGSVCKSSKSEKPKQEGGALTLDEQQEFHQLEPGHSPKTRKRFWKNPNEPPRKKSRQWQERDERLERQDPAAKSDRKASILDLPFNDSNELNSRLRSAENSEIQSRTTGEASQNYVTLSSAGQLPPAVQDLASRTLTNKCHLQTKKLMQKVRLRVLLRKVSYRKCRMAQRASDMAPSHRTPGTISRTEVHAARKPTALREEHLLERSSTQLGDGSCHAVATPQRTPRTTAIASDAANQVRARMAQQQEMRSERLRILFSRQPTPLKSPIEHTVTAPQERLQNQQTVLSAPDRTQADAAKQNVLFEERPAVTRQNVSSEGSNRCITPRRNAPGMLDAVLEKISSMAASEPAKKCDGAPCSAAKNGDDATLSCAAKNRDDANEQLPGQKNASTEARKLDAVEKRVTPCGGAFRSGLFELHERKADYKVKLRSCMAQEQGVKDVKAIVPISQVENKFIVGRLQHDEEDWVVVIDQHAASERVNLEIVQKWPVTGNVMRPFVCTLQAADVRALKQTEMFQFTVLNETEICVSKLPCINGEPIPPLRIVTSQLSNTDAVHCTQASKACHRSIRFGDKLDAAQVRTLVQDLGRCQDPFHCAHGRPTAYPLVNLRRFREEFKRVPHMQPVF